MPYIQLGADSPAEKRDCGCGGRSGRGAATLGEIGQPVAATTPAFRFFCAPGCAPHTAGQCRAIVSRAIRDAIWLADNAAAKLEARDGEALRLFRFFFGNPAHVVDGLPAADVVARRFRATAQAFRTRVPHIRCSATCADVALVQPRAAPSAANPLPRNTIILCPPFWGAYPAGTHPRWWRAATMAHEMLHLLYWEFFGHQVNLPRPGDPIERRRDNSNCYDAFVLRVAGHGGDSTAVADCVNRPV